MIPRKLAHKLQNMLFVIMGYIDLSKDDETWRQKAYDMIRQMSELINEHIEKKK